MMLMISPSIQIPLSEMALSYVRSSGPGGQNVNKVNSKAVLRWNLLSTQSLRPDVLARVLARLQTRLTHEGDLILTSDRYRDQIQNREDCFEKLKELLLLAVHIPKSRKKTKPSKGSQRRLKESKSRHSQKKKLRRGQDD